MLRKMIEIKPKRVVYVFNDGTLARDLRVLKDVYDAIGNEL
ncbi:hypothetical protein CHCC5022_1898 [Bacillus paralicheniformis]|nr:hypothetical protein CHCC5022_1898 [Bacillus paralicheniformis]TWJ81934.1 hypothetical protein CHCC4186_3725 [Bacillus paralicheniformis]